MNSTFSGGKIMVLKPNFSKAGTNFVGHIKQKISKPKKL